MSKPKDVIAQIKKATRRQFLADENIRIVPGGLRGETPISEICGREGIAVSVYYKWSKTFSYRHFVSGSGQKRPNKGCDTRCDCSSSYNR